MALSPRGRGVLLGAATLLLLLIATVIFLSDAPASPESLEAFDTGTIELEEESVHRVETAEAEPETPAAVNQRAVTAPPTRRDLLVVSLRWDGGEPIPSAPVVMIRPDGRRVVHETNEQGEVEFQTTERGWLVGRPPAAPPVTRAFPAGAQKVALVAPTGFRVLGRLFIDDVPAGEGYRLFISPWGYGWNVVPRSILDAMPPNETPRGFEAITDAEGRFVLEALPPVKGFGIRLPAGLRVAKNAPYARNTLLHIDDILHDDTLVEIRTTPSPSVVGSCLDVSGRPVVGARVTFMHEKGRSRYSLVPPVMTDEQGKFRGWLDP
ncbi:MAG TPA: carboxypeptidase regulatory-like domain-containing protein, partial [Planctomycetes bacterium]|nr:carboxypeptidase regulatory-like domain-containing protein [Planctomycetota bacterium]